ncbi:ABC transporter substrate-binding protein [Rivularia sp. UHCC 0363]|uniref:ABC transporter substrate-binding protein n=1 Tax=Rivularia sp. UHCC 0363 TaxID=3110244 RepID=UPI002B217BCA|nr:ABC transporter substrate-binding protein [Rivularia sp. UHCC 0363]MEA5598397.1 ABC transporter substrate-binding protein [Rivularia sp. UHCC 0363]
MSKFVVLNIDEGSFELGFRVRLGIGEDGPTYFRQEIMLPPAPDIPRFYQDWQDKYRELGKTRQINIPPAQITNCSVIEDENQARNRFEKYLNEWFNQLPFRELQVRIEEKTQQKETIRIIIDTKNIYLKKLPWHLWQLFHNRPQAEFALSAEYAPPSEPLKRPVKILAIFGGSQGLDLTLDRQLLTNLKNRGAKVTSLEKPQKKQLSHSLWEQHWDILFFAGHSSSGEECKTGEIQINDSESISLTRLRNALRTAVDNGLKLAIFNSCDGLGLADELSSVRVPQMIVMREPVPDEVARQFLQYFLEDFSQGHSLYLAVRNARQRLEWMEDKFPCASWLPIICQNPAARPLIWAKSSMTVVKRSVLAGIAITFIFFGNQIYKKIGEGNHFYQSQPTSKAQKNITSPINLRDTLQDLGENFSWGEKILISYNSNQWKQRGIEAFSQKKYERSIEYFDKSLQLNKNDPETLIYLNNAVAMIPSESDKLPVPTTSTLKSCIIQNPKPLQIAVIAPIFGNTTNQINEETLRGVAQAQNATNLSCGIKGRLLQVIIVDDRDKASTSSQVAKTLVDEKDILAVVGHYSSRATIEAGKVYQEKQMVVVSPTSTAVRKSPNKDYGINLNKYVFRTPTNDAIAIKDLVNYMLRILGKTEAAIAYDSSGSYSKTYREELKKQLQSIENGRLINLTECDLYNNPNLENCVKKANAAVSVLVLVPETGVTFNKALDILDSNNGSNLTLFGGDSLYSKAVENKGGKVRNLIIPIPWFQNEVNKSPFEADAQELWNAQVNWRTAMSYDATMVITEGLRRMGNDPSREGLQQILSAKGFSAEGAAGTVEFENGDRRITDERKVTPENKTQIGVLVQVKCDTQTLPSTCKFVRVPQQ